MKYEQSINAALSETNSKFELAEALALDIPEQQGKTGVMEALTEVREAIIDAGGEPRAVGTLGNYRKTGLHFARKHAKWGWVKGVSFTSHMEAYHAGIPADEFAAAPKTVREIREENGAASKDGAPAKVIAGWSEEQKAEAREQLMQDAVKQIAEQEPRSLPPLKKGKTKEVQIEEANSHRQLVLAMAEIMHFSRSTIQRAKTATKQFEAVMPSPWWEKGFPGETRHRTHEEQVLGDIDNAIEALHEMRNRVAHRIDAATERV